MKTFLKMLNPVPIRSITVGCGTPVHSLSKLCQLAIEHLTHPTELPRNRKSTKHVLRGIVNINENSAPLPDTATFAFGDAVNMYPSTDVEQGLQSVRRRLTDNPSPLGLSPETIERGLRICMRCNAIKFQDKFYLPKRGVAQGTCHACDFTDLWMGEVTQKHLDTSPLPTLHFQLYRDDSIDILVNGVEEKRILEHQMASLHENLTWTVTCGKEGGYLDLWLMLKDGYIEWKNYLKCPPIYVGPDSCHDPSVIGAIVKGVGLRLRINSSKDEYFDESVEQAARAFKMSGYSYQHTKQELMGFKNFDPIDLIKKEKVDRHYPERGVKAFYISKYDPRMPHPRKLISRNYHHIASNPDLAALFPRENLIGGTKRDRNLGEMMSPADQSVAPGGDQGGPGPGPGPGGGARGADGGRWNGSYHCENYKKTSKCDLCSHMVETSFVTSYYFQRRFAIHGRNIHLKASLKNKMVWFIYLIHDTERLLLYVGSTTDPCKRWSSTKSACQHRKVSNTGLYSHFKDGCPTHLETGNLEHLTITLIDSMTTSEEKLEDAGHTGGVQCRCSECERLKSIEDKWICRLGSFHQNGLNTRDEIKSRDRVNFRRTGDS